MALTQGWGGREAAGPYYNFNKPCYLLRYASFDLFVAVPRVSSKIQGIRRPAKRYVRPPPDRDEQAFRRLIQAQQAFGYWELTVWLAKQTGESIEVFRLIASVPHLPKRLARRVVATLIALFLLHTRFQPWQAEWALVAAKAERWLKARNLTPPPPIPEVLPWLKEALAGSILSLHEVKGTPLGEPKGN